MSDLFFKELLRQKWFPGMALYAMLALGGCNIWFIAHLVEKIEMGIQQAETSTIEIRVLQAQMDMVLTALNVKPAKYNKPPRKMSDKKPL